MKEVFEAYLELNKQMLLAGMNSKYEIILQKQDFMKMAAYMVDKFSPLIYSEPNRRLEDLESFNIAGPGGYITFRKMK